MPLATCPECLRHVRVGEAVCPFCDQPLPADLSSRVQNRPIDPKKFGRAAFVSFGAALASTAAGCGSGDGGDGGDVRQKQGQDEATGGSQNATDAGANGGAGGSAGAGSGGLAGAGGQVAQPVYGVPIDPPPVEPMPQPEYGVAIDYDASTPAAEDAAMPAEDAGASANDAGEKPDGGLVAVPVYGIPID